MNHPVGNKCPSCGVQTFRGFWGFRVFGMCRRCVKKYRPEEYNKWRRMELLRLIDKEESSVTHTEEEGRRIDPRWGEVEAYMGECDA